MKKFIKQFTNKDIFKEENLVEINKRVYLVRPSTKKIMNKTTMYADTYLGRKGTHYFIPSVFLLNEVKKHTKHRVVVTKKGEWLFTCGRNLWRNNIHSSSIKEGVALVFNQDDECLGFGRLQQGKVALNVLFDIGDFLRRERKFKG
jgi:ribosome biogenesis protein Nip4